MTFFINILNRSNKDVALKEILTAGQHHNPPHVFDVSPGAFSEIPRSPFSYWSSEALRKLFRDLPPVNHGGRVARDTNPPGDDLRYIRAIWEVPQYGAGSDWIPLCKGGAFSPIFQDIHLVVGWDEARNTYPGFVGTSHRPMARPASLDFFFRAGLTWSRRSQRGFSLRVMPQGCIFAQKGPAVFVEGDNIQDLLALAAVGNSTPFRRLIDLQMAFGAYEVGVVQRTPVPLLRAEQVTTLAHAAGEYWDIQRKLQSVRETSTYMDRPALLQVTGDSVEERWNAWRSSKLPLKLGWRNLLEMLIS